MAIKKVVRIGKDGQSKETLGVNDIISQIGGVAGSRTDLISLANALGINTIVNNTKVPVILPETFVGKTLALSAGTITLSQTNINYTMDGGTVAVQIYTSGIFQVSDIPPWIRASASYGINNATISFTANPNNSVNTSPRNGTIRFLGTGNVLRATLTVSQAGNPIVQQISPTGPTTLESTSGTTNIDVTLSDILSISNYSLTNTNGFSISSPIETDLGSSIRYRFVLTRTSASTERETTFQANITNEDESYNDTLTSRFIQSGFSPTMNIPTSTLSFTQATQILNFSLTSNTTWSSAITGTGFEQSLSSSGPFVTTNLTGTEDATIYVRALTNDGGDRTGRVTVTTTYTSNNTSDFVDLDQDSLPEFQFSNWTGGINILSNGSIQVTNGNSPSVSISPTSYSSVSSDTNRTVTCTVTVPSGWRNATRTVSGTKSDTQPYGPSGNWAPPNRNWTANQSGTSVAQQFDITSNYGISTVTLSNTSDFTLSYVSIGRYNVYPRNTNSSASTKTGVLSFTIQIPLSGETFTYIANVSQTPASPPTVQITNPQSLELTFSNTAFSSLGLTGQINSNGGGNISSIGFALEDGPGSDFKLVQRFGDNVTVGTGDWVATVSNPTTSVFTVGVIPRGDNTSGSPYSDRVRFYASNDGGTGFSSWVTLTQEADTFEFADAGITGFTVNRDTGQVTAPTSTTGATITNRVYSSGYSGGFYPVVTSNTSRSVTVTVTVPSGYTNSGGTVSGTVSVTQLSAIEFIDLDDGATYATDIPADGGITTISVNTQDIYSTAWTAEVYQYINGSDWITYINPTTGTGDNNSLQVAASANWPSTTGYTSPSREAVIRVYKTGNTGIADTIRVKQPAGTPPLSAPTISSKSPSGDISFESYQQGSNNAVTVTYVRSSGTNNAPTSVSFYLVSTDVAFGLYQTDSNVSVTNIGGGIWSTSVTNPAASSFSVGVYPLNPNETPDTNTAQLTFSMGNSAGNVSDTKNISQTGDTVWSLSTIPNLSNAAYSREKLTTEFSKNVPYVFNYLDSIFDRTNFGLFVENGSYKGHGISVTSNNLTAGTKYFAMTYNSSMGSYYSNTTMRFDVGELVAIQYSVGTATRYMIGTVISYSTSTRVIGVTITSGNIVGGTSSAFTAWEISQISGGSTTIPTIYARKLNEAGARSTTIKLDDKDNTYGLGQLSRTITQNAGDLTGTMVVNGVNQGNIQDNPYYTATATYSNGYPSPTAWSVGLNTNFATPYRASITQGSSFAGLSLSQDLSGGGAGSGELDGNTRAGSSSTLFYINLKSNTTTRSRTVEVAIEFLDFLYTAIINITVNGTSGGTGGPGGGVDPGDTV